MEVTHIAFDRDDHIYFTNGEEVYRIIFKPALEVWDDGPEELWAPQGDTSHITSLWRQGDLVHWTVQDWNKEEDIDLYRVRAAKKGAGGTTPTTPNTPRKKSFSVFSLPGLSQTNISQTQADPIYRLHPFSSPSQLWFPSRFPTKFAAIPKIVRKYTKSSDVQFAT